MRTFSNLPHGERLVGGGPGLLRRNMIRVCVGGSFGLIWSSLSSAQSTFEVSIHRKFSSASCTSGYLGVNGQIIAYALELPWHDNAPLISSIPAGTYGATLRYDHTDHWRIELRDVPGRTNVQIHVGNTTEDTRGCILVGMQITSNLCGIAGGSSRPAYERLRTLFYGTANPTSTPNKEIRVKIEDMGRDAPDPMRQR